MEPALQSSTAPFEVCASLFSVAALFMVHRSCTLFFPVPYFTATPLSDEIGAG